MTEYFCHLFFEMNNKTIETRVDKSNIYLVKNAELNDFKQGIANKVLFTITGPSAVGKDTVVDILLKEHPDIFVKPTSFTTRAKREKEIEGVNYYFISKEEYQKLKEDDGIFESTNFNGNYYGFTVAEMQRIFATGKVPVCVLDDYGVRHMNNNGKHFGLSVFKSFVLPPNAFELKKRLIKRDGRCRIISNNGCEKSELLKRFRLGNEMIRSAIYCGGYNSYIINANSSETAYQVMNLFKSIIDGTFNG